MTTDDFHRFTSRLVESVEPDPAILGLVALGSMAGIDYVPDNFSDHDFFVVVSHGQQERLKTDLSWLPDYDEIVLAFRETDHGMKALYRSGHLLEFAVFDGDELHLARVNRYRVLLDRADVGHAMERVRSETVRVRSAARDDARFLVGMFLSNLLVGVGRYARGERLSGANFVKCHAVSHLLTLAAKTLDPDPRAAVDDLDPYRRFERAYPELGATVEQALTLQTPRSARALLEVARNTFAFQFAQIGADAVATVERRIDDVIGMHGQA